MSLSPFCAALRRRALPLAATLLLTTPGHGAENHAGISSEVLLQTTRAWDGTAYRAYPTGQPEITMARVSVAPHTSFDWHTHPVISAVYIVAGELRLEKRGVAEPQVYRAGDALADVVDVVHRGHTGEQPVVMLVFFAGSPGTPLRLTSEQ